MFNIQHASHTHPIWKAAIALQRRIVKTGEKANYVNVILATFIHLKETRKKYNERSKKSKKNKQIKRTSKIYEGKTAIQKMLRKKMYSIER